MAPEKIIDQIQIILRKAEDPATTPEEAEMLTDRAEKLMIKFGVEEAMLEAAKTGEQPKEQIVERKIVVNGTWREADLQLAQGVANGLGNIKILHSSSRRYVGGKLKTLHFVYFIGFESDVDRAIMLWESLKLQGYAAMAAWWKDEQHWHDGHAKFIERRTFLFSFASGVQRRLTRNRRQVHEQVASEPGTALVLRDRGQAVDTWLADTYPKLRSTRSSYLSGSAGREAGYEAGLNARTGESEIGARGQIGRK